MLFKSSKDSKILPKVKTSAGEEPLEWWKRIIRRQKPKKIGKKQSTGGRHREMHSSHEMWLINGPDPISKAKSTEENGGYWRGPYGICDNDQ